MNCGVFGNQYKMQILGTEPSISEKGGIKLTRLKELCWSLDRFLHRIILNSLVNNVLYINSILTIYLYNLVDGYIVR